MKLEIHHAIYGRVERGVSGAGSGYQWAAHTRALRETPRLLDALAIVGQMSDPRGGPRPPRLGCFCPVEGWLAFMQVVWGTDSTGRESCFAHHQVTRLRDILALGLPTALLLQKLRFFSTEAELPTSRWAGEPETLELSGIEYGWPDTPLEPLQIAVLDELERSDSGRKPAWLTGTLPVAKILESLANMQSVLPPETAASLSFCLNFCHSLEGLAAFRLLTVPEESLLGQPRSQCRTFSESSICPPNSPFAILSVGETAGAVRRSLALLGGHGQSSEEDRINALMDPALLPALDWAEKLWADWCLGWLTADPFRYCSLHAGIRSWAIDPLWPAFSQQPVAWFAALAPNLAALPRQRGLLCEWTLRVWASGGEAAAELLAVTANGGFLDEIASTSIAVGPNVALPAAETLASTEDPNRSMLHRAIALHLLRLQTMPMVLREASPWFSNIADYAAWLVASERRAHCGSTAILLEGVTDLLSGMPPRDLAEVDSLDDSSYQVMADLLKYAAAHGTYRNVEDWMRLLSVRRHRAITLQLLCDLTGTNCAGPAFGAAGALGLLNSPSEAESLLGFVETRRSRAAAKAWIRAIRQGLVEATPEVSKRLEGTASIIRGLFRQ